MFSSAEGLEESLQWEKTSLEDQTFSSVTKGGVAVLWSRALRDKDLTAAMGLGPCPWAWTLAPQWPLPGQHRPLTWPWAAGRAGGTWQSPLRAPGHSPCPQTPLPFPRAFPCTARAGPGQAEAGPALPAPFEREQQRGPSPARPSQPGPARGWIRAGTGVWDPAGTGDPAGSGWGTQVSVSILAHPQVWSVGPGLESGVREQFGVPRWH